MSLIRISNLSFSYDDGDRLIFDQVNLSLDTDWKLGLIGRNGMGKSTLLRLLAGELEHGGAISAPVRFRYFPFPVPCPERTALDIALEASPDAEAWSMERELALMETDPALLERPFDSLSGGERAKVMLAALFLGPGNFPLIDEPTNHLDVHGRRAVSAYLHKKRGFLLVSHDRAFLDSCIDHVMSINRADIEIQQGNYSSWKQNRDYQDAFEMGRREKLKKDMARLTEAARQAAQWSDKTEKTKFKPHDGKVSRFQQAMINRGEVGHKAAKMMRRSKNLEDRRQKAVDEAAGLLLNLETAESLKIHPLEHHARVLAEATDLGLWYEPDKPVFEGLRFRLEQGQRLAVTGRNGSGKSSLLDLLEGRERAHGGSFRRAGGIVISRVNQDLSWMKGSLAAFCRENRLDENLFRAILSRLGLGKEYWNADLRALSDGQRKKAALANSLSRQAHLYLWDEPLNFMDVLAREQLEELLLNHTPTMVFVEHDEAFVRHVATDRLEL